MMSDVVLWIGIIFGIFVIAALISMIRQIWSCRKENIWMADKILSQGGTDVALDKELRSLFSAVHKVWQNWGYGITGFHINKWTSPWWITILRKPVEIFLSCSGIGRILYFCASIVLFISLYYMLSIEMFARIVGTIIAIIIANCIMRFLWRGESEK